MKTLTLAAAVLAAASTFGRAADSPETGPSTQDQGVEMVNPPPRTPEPSASGSGMGPGITGDAAQGLGVSDPGPMDDASVADIIRTVNSIEIEGARTAQQKAERREVKDFAREMIADHQRSESEMAALVKRLGIEPKQSAFARQMRQDHEAQAAQLAGQQGAGFDGAYVRSQVDAHRKTLETLDKALTSGERRDERFADQLRKTRETVERHLRHAEKLQSERRTQ